MHETLFTITLGFGLCGSVVLPIYRSALSKQGQAEKEHAGIRCRMRGRAILT